MSKEIPKNLKPRQMWLVIYECRFDVIVVSPMMDGFFAPGQEPCWGFDSIQEWIREIPQVQYLTWEEAPNEFRTFVEDVKRIPSSTYDTLSNETKELLDTEYERYLKEKH